MWENDISKHITYIQIHSHWVAFEGVDFLKKSG